MKKILSLLTVITLTASTSTTVISCSKLSDTTKKSDFQTLVGENISKYKFKDINLMVDSLNKFKDQHELDWTIREIKKDVVYQLFQFTQKNILANDLVFINLNQFKLNESLSKTFKVEFTGKGNETSNELIGGNSVNVKFEHKFNLNNKKLAPLTVNVINNKKVTYKEQEDIYTRMQTWIKNQLTQISTYDLIIGLDYETSGFNVSSGLVDMSKGITEQITALPYSNYIYGTATLNISVKNS